RTGGGDQERRLLAGPAVGRTEGKEGGHEGEQDQGQTGLVGTERQLDPGNRLSEGGDNRTVRRERSDAEGCPPGEDHDPGAEQPARPPPRSRQKVDDERPGEE